MSETSMMTDAATTTEGGTPSTSAAPAATGGAQQQQATAAQGTQDAATTAEGNGQTNNGESGGNSTGAPESYDLKVPEGAAMDTEGVTAFGQFARELNLSNEAAQKMMDKMAPAMAQRQQAAIDKAITTWGESAKTDKEFGGQQLDQNLAVAKKALDTFGTPELRELLVKSGLGNHPEVIRVFYRAGKAISEDNFVPGGQGRPQQGNRRDPAAVLYSNQS
jgi:hypothetical protein